MKFITVLFFILCVILFLGSGKYFADVKRPGVYPPKQILKSRALVCASGGGICLLIALMFSYFS
ncbi:hypothetical protein [Neobacillus mesonae]|uniref:hypothetical protein n=1 Tax=Neobacillus mesonae TaxID=1193713 RepID=UPI000832F4DA|nr:hypothetical protein [Neobacillus mesonae]MED4206063.1 hypothetical protein [Neobacillus mesonae]